MRQNTTACCLTEAVKLVGITCLGVKYYFTNKQPIVTKSK